MQTACRSARREAWLVRCNWLTCSDPVHFVLDVEGRHYRDYFEDGIGKQLQDTLNRTAVVGYVSPGEHSKERGFAIVLGDAEKFIKSYVALSGDRSTVGKMQYKSDMIAEKLHMRPDSPKGRFRVYSSDEFGNEVANKRGIVVFG